MSATLPEDAIAEKRKTFHQKGIFPEEEESNV
jgi:hypothetical protein